MKASKLTSKFQTTIPKKIREFLSLNKGDGVSFEIENGQVVIKKLTKKDLEWQKFVGSTLTQEWSSKEDEEAYGNL